MLVVFFSLFLVVSAVPKKNKASTLPVDRFEVGRHTFFDFGPPFDFYELLLVRPSGSGSFVQRIILTPRGKGCSAPAAIEMASATMSESVSTILGNANPCAIPEKELRRELKRCKHCVVYSGANVTMQVPCGAGSRLIRSDILDRDLFDPAAKTPEHTSWTMELLARLDRALGPGVMERPAFSLPGEDKVTQTKLDPETRQGLESGAYDALFPKAEDRVSDMYRATLGYIPLPSVQLLGSSPFGPQDAALPQYPPLARATRTEGTVSFTLVPNADGSSTSLTFTKGHPLLLEAVRQTVATWKFPKEAAGQTVSASILFSLNCQNPSK